MERGFVPLLFLFFIFTKRQIQCFFCNLLPILPAHLMAYCSDCRTCSHSSRERRLRRSSLRRRRRWLTPTQSRQTKKSRTHSRSTRLIISGILNNKKIRSQPSMLGSVRLDTIATKVVLFRSLVFDSLLLADCRFCEDTCPRAVCLVHCPNRFVTFQGTAEENVIQDVVPVQREEASTGRPVALLEGADQTAAAEEAAGQGRAVRRRVPVLPRCTQVHGRSPVQTQPNRQRAHGPDIRTAAETRK